MSHSIHMLSIQIDAESFEFAIYHQFHNIKLPFFASQWKGVFHFVRLLNAVLFLGTWEYEVIAWGLFGASDVGKMY